MIFAVLIWSGSPTLIANRLREAPRARAIERMPEHVYFHFAYDGVVEMTELSEAKREARRMIARIVDPKANSERGPSTIHAVLLCEPLR